MATFTERFEATTDGKRPPQSTKFVFTFPYMKVEALSLKIEFYPPNSNNCLKGNFIYPMQYSKGAVYTFHIAAVSVSIECLIEHWGTTEPFLALEATFFDEGGVELGRVQRMSQVGVNYCDEIRSPAYGRKIKSVQITSPNTSNAIGWFTMTA